MEIAIEVLAERGAEAAGVDADPAEIRRAQARAREAGLAPELRVARPQIYYGEQTLGRVRVINTPE